MMKYSEICDEIINKINKYDIPNLDKMLILQAAANELKKQKDKL